MVARVVVEFGLEDRHTAPGTCFPHQVSQHMKNI